ncbi:MAG: aminopeptidase P family protein, partial [Actinomycetota bacterium]|nr:aminopeptidase P family protein [Actinomycetota bacterium]
MASKLNRESRIERVREESEKLGLACLLVSKRENVFYLSGFSGSSATLFISPQRLLLLTDGRYRLQAKAEAKDWEVEIYEGELPKRMASLLPQGKIGIEASINLSFFNKIKEGLPPGCSLEPVDGLVEKGRAKKDNSEIAAIKESLACTKEALAQTRKLIKPGMTERRIQAELEYRMKLSGADRPAFDTICASGENSSMPHASITDRKLESADIVLLDFGAEKNGYASDITRTFLLEGADERKVKILEAVKGALVTAFEFLKVERKAEEIDKKVRSYFEERGLREYFTHSLGHGVGLEVHEKPTLSPNSKDVLEPGMVFTLEPGIYIEGWGGVRLEEMV